MKSLRGKRAVGTIWIAVGLLLVAIPGAWAGTTTAQERLGKQLYEDPALSDPPVQSCKTCHHPAAGFADPENRLDLSALPVSDGADGVSFGGRNAPTSAYAGYSPPLSQAPDGQWYGGMFWDGRADGAVLGDTLAEQAMGPPTNPAEMANSEFGVVSAALDASYGALFVQICGTPDLAQEDSVHAAYICIAQAIAAYERTTIVNKFKSDFDAWLAGAYEMNATQRRGHGLFITHCAGCHPDVVVGVEPAPIFTRYGYANLGLPYNEVVVNGVTLLPSGDPGLGGFLDDATQLGKFKVPTLRNVAKTAPYGHNGYFSTLVQFVNFLNTRDDPAAGWSAADVAQNVTQEVGDLGLTARQVEDLVAFLNLLSDADPDAAP